uniref:Protocadherin 2 gamma 28 n=1 Tax=Hippocampus comes TaxID=109280 RepID=A0A3Q2XEU0_HIPCM
DIETYRTAHLFFCLHVTDVADAHVRYSIPEEMAIGSIVGNIAQDLGLDIKRLKFGRARIFTEDSSEYIALNLDKGMLEIKQRIDREERCGQVSPCSLHFQIILNNPMQLHHVDVEIIDINDNAPIFSKREMNFEISESAAKGARFSLDGAKDPDVGSNTLHTYKLSPTDPFKLNILSRPDGTKYVEMTLDALLDREIQEEHKLTLTAYDGGDPPKSSSIRINVIVVDANDNAPVFSQSRYRTSVPENTARGTNILQVSAIDVDKGANGEVAYSFSQNSDVASSVFNIQANTGEISVMAELNYEKVKQYEIDVEATDKGGLRDTCKVFIEIVDLNDNAPVISILSLSNPIPEDSPLETTITMLNVKDLDSGKNGEVKCFISPDLPFKIKSSSLNFYSLVSDDVLDRETVAQYNITITAIDEGTPPRSTNKTINLKLSDVNDNAPMFQRASYSASATENNAPGVPLLAVEASDKDSGNNARISYFLEDVKLYGMSASAFFTVNAESGEIMAVRSFDYEQTKEFHIRVRAQDGGSPPLSSNVSVRILIQDQNDNAPQVLYPVQTGGSLLAEMVPRSADVSVCACDARQPFCFAAVFVYRNEKICYRALFELYTGEVRTKRTVYEHDDSSQRLIVEVKDDGEPVQSATVTLSILLEDGVSEPVLELRHKASEPGKKGGRITLYLIVALASVSVLSLLTLLVLGVKCVKSSTSGATCCVRRTLSDEDKKPNRNLHIQLNTDGPIKYVEVLGGDVMSQSHSFRSCMSPMSEYSDFTLVKPSSTTDFKEVISVLDASLPDSTWTFESQQVSATLVCTQGELGALHSLQFKRFPYFCTVVIHSHLQQYSNLTISPENTDNTSERGENAVTLRVNEDQRPSDSLVEVRAVNQ